jgi:hypothetical protein
MDKKMKSNDIPPIHERFDHLLNLIGSERFLKKKGLGNEVPFFICPYPPEEALEMDRMRQQIMNKLEHQGIAVLDVNLYDISIELIKKRNIWDRVFEMEPKISKEDLRDLLMGVLDPENHLVPRISEIMETSPFDVMFISGVGEVFPYIRSHKVLSNLQSTAKEQPTVMFFPGLYTHSLEKGASLNLFGKCPTDKYYRAFNIYHCEI